MSSETLLDLARYFVPVILSLSWHECAHALSAHWLGDDTAKEQGRLTLNPLSHIDPFGTLLLPLVAILGHAPVLGWAKPTPFTPSRFSRRFTMDVSALLVALAGPGSNLVLGLLCAILLSIVVHAGATSQALLDFLSIMLRTNVFLAVFNLLPVPPLDGGRIYRAILPYSARPALDAFERFAPILLLVLFFVGPLSRALSVVISVPALFLLNGILHLVGLAS